MKLRSILKKNKHEISNKSENVINEKRLFHLRVFDDFRQIKDKYTIGEMPTINKCEVEDAVIKIYLTASNTNGFHFKIQIKSINIKEKWNNHFVRNHEL